MSNDTGGGRLSSQSSFRTSLVSIATAATGLVSYLVIKYLGKDPQLAGLLVTLFNTVAVAAAGYGSMLAERGAKADSHQIASEAGAAAAVPVAAETAAAVVKGEDV